MHDFGRVEIGNEVRHVFAVSNSGDRPLTVVAGRTDCACGITVGGSGTLAAGEAGWVEVAFDTRRSPGERRERFLVETNDPARPRVAFTLRGVVEADVLVRPAKAFLGRVPRGRAHEVFVDVETAAGVVIDRVRKKSPRFDIRVDRLTPPRIGIRLYVTLKPQERPGPFDDRVEVWTSSAAQPRVVVPVLASIE